MFVERRNHPRFQVSVPVEVHAEGSETPIRCTTSVLSLGGCYIESLYPFPVATCLELKLQVDETLLVLAKVVTCYPQVGNGMQFIKNLPEDRDSLANFLNAVAQHELAHK